ncbi:unnamed protein product [Blumeria hordei]|uniref:Apoptosis-inducing TAF9-like domain 1 family protein n=2 Tax=Blumeria hordei TaxID=2867405 RepID=A0A383UWL6_BLUHO|nr:apoptosis-inducing TAF9-like domain 1 family protein [Blumeria hordei DH14]SZF04136.1 unnamed protein product [Blumeria hordei]
MADADAEIRERLKASLWHKVGSLVTAETLELSGKHDMPISATPQFIGALTEMVWAQVESVSADVEAFARHAGRSVVGTEDVLLMARRNEALEGLLRRWIEEEAEREQDRPGAKSGVKRKGKAAKRK